MFRASHLGEDDSHHQCLNHDADDALQAHSEDGFGTLLGGESETVADGVLGFDAEQEAGREGVNVRDAGSPLLLFLRIDKSIWVE